MKTNKAPKKASILFTDLLPTPDLPLVNKQEMPNKKMTKLALAFDNQQQNSHTTICEKEIYIHNNTHQNQRQVRLHLTHWSYFEHFKLRNSAARR